MSALPDLERRRLATRATEAKFRWKPFDWKSGRHCLALAHFHLKGLGHKLEPLPRIRGALAARRQLDERGWGDCTALLEGLGLERIGAARLRLGDLVTRASEPGTAGIGSIFIHVAPGAYLGWCENEEARGLCVVVDCEVDQLEACFRG